MAPQKPDGVPLAVEAEVVPELLVVVQQFFRIPYRISNLQ